MHLATIEFKLIYIDSGKINVAYSHIMALPGIEPGHHPRQGCSLPLAYKALFYLLNISRNI